MAAPCFVGTGCHRGQWPLLSFLRRLVPKESPIHQSGLLFYNTLFDENAACHLALGFGFDECVKGFENMTKEELYESGVNDAGNHTDFMIGSDDLSIDGVDEHGNVHPIFRNGTWAF